MHPEGFLSVPATVVSDAADAVPLTPVKALAGGGAAPQGGISNRGGDIR
jgi:hypothetical protein